MSRSLGTGWQVFAIIATVTGFVVDIAAIFAVVRLITVSIEPSVGQPSRPLQGFELTIPESLEATTLIVWVYAALAVYFLIPFGLQERASPLPKVFSITLIALGAMIPALIATWFLVFRHIDQDVYGVLLPLCVATGLTFANLAPRPKLFPDAQSENGCGVTAGCLALQALIGVPLTFWYLSNFQLAPLLSLLAAIVTLIVGTGIGFVLHVFGIQGYLRALGHADAG